MDGLEPIHEAQERDRKDLLQPRLVPLKPNPDHHRSHTSCPRWRLTSPAATPSLPPGACPAHDGRRSLPLARRPRLRAGAHRQQSFLTVPRAPFLAGRRPHRPDARVARLTLPRCSRAARVCHEGGAGLSPCARNTIREAISRNKHVEQPACRTLRRLGPKAQFIVWFSPGLVGAKLNRVWFGKRLNL